jgi:DNA-directed RNA polymerase specialized sigma24 family protein
LVLSLFHGFSGREIAAILEIPHGTVKTRMMHGERKLRRLLEAKGVTP